MDSGKNATLALDKAIQIANRFSCDIHLVYIHSARNFNVFQNIIKNREHHNLKTERNSVKLKELEERCRRKLLDGLITTSSLESGNWQMNMKQTIITEHIDLVIVSKRRKRIGNSFKNQIDLNRLSQQTQCSILIVTRKFNLSHMQNIVVPVNEFLPVRKLTIATYICRELNGSIHLMGNSSSTSKEKSGKRHLIKAYQLLSDYGHVKIHCSLPGSYENEGSTLSYARNVKADLIVVNSGRESLLFGWWNRLMGNYLYWESEIPVLTVSPQQGYSQLILN